jgi:ASC-1-like (ASCH) protein
MQLSLAQLKFVDMKRKFAASYASCHKNMTVLAKYCRDIVEGRKKVEGRPCRDVAETVREGDYLNLGVAYYWVVAVVVSCNIQSTCRKMVEVRGWRALVPDSGSIRSCVRVYKKMYPKWAGRWVSFELQVLEYKMYKGVQTAVCGVCQVNFESYVLDLFERKRSPDRVCCAACNVQSTCSFPH